MNKWNDVRESTPIIDEYLQESEEVLCVCRKFGFSQNRTETDEYVVLTYGDDGAWYNDTTDFENNNNYMYVVYWKYIDKDYLDM